MTITTALAPAEAEARIRRLVRPRLSGIDWLAFWFTWDGRRPPEFVGWVSGQEFRLRRLFGVWQYAFFPVLIGRIASDPEGTKIQITMRPWALDLLGPAMALGVAAYASWASGTIIMLAFVIAVVLPFALLGWVTGARQARKILSDAL